MAIIRFPGIGKVETMTKLQNKMVAHLNSKIQSNQNSVN